MVQLGALVSALCNPCLYQISCTRQLIQQDLGRSLIYQKNQRAVLIILYFHFNCFCHFDYSFNPLTNFNVSRNENASKHFSFIKQTKKTVSQFNNSLPNPILPKMATCTDTILYGGKWESARFSLPMSTWERWTCESLWEPLMLSAALRNHRLATMQLGGFCVRHAVRRSFLYDQLQKS